MTNDDAKKLAKDMYDANELHIKKLIEQQLHPPITLPTKTLRDDIILVMAGKLRPSDYLSTEAWAKDVIECTNKLMKQREIKG